MSISPSVVYGTTILEALLPENPVVVLRYSMTRRSRLY
jgi:hypothetical protein